MLTALFDCWGSSDPVEMLSELTRGNDTPRVAGGQGWLTTERKLRLYAVACTHQVWHLLTSDDECLYCEGHGSRRGDVLYGEPDGLVDCTPCNGSGRINYSHRAIMAAEKAADCQYNNEIIIARRMAHAVHRSSIPGPEMAAAEAANTCALTAAMRVTWSVKSTRCGDRRRILPYLLNDIVGNTRNPVVIDPSWRTPDVLSMAEAIYNERPGRECLRHEKVCFVGHVHGNDRCSIHHARLGAIHKTPLTCNCIPEDCPDCRGTGKLDFAAFDQQALDVLADALKEAGIPQEMKIKAKMAGNCLTCGVPCQHDGIGRPEAVKCPVCGRLWVNGDHYTVTRQHPIIEAIASPRPKYRGFWPIDLFLWKC